MVGDRFDLDFSWLSAGSMSPWPFSLSPGRSDEVEKTAATEDAADRAADFKKAGIILAIGGAGISAIGAFSTEQSKRYQSESQALALDYEASLSGISARDAELEAQSIQRAGQHEIMRLTMEAGQQAGATRAATAARGVRLGRGSAARVAASQELRKRLDVAALRENMVLRTAEARMRGVRAEGRALLQRTAARAARRSARLFDPYVAAVTSLLSSAASFGSQVASDSLRAYAAGESQ